MRYAQDGVSSMAMTTHIGVKPGHCVHDEPVIAYDAEAGRLGLWICKCGDGWPSPHFLAFGFVRYTSPRFTNSSDATWAPLTPVGQPP